MPPHPAVQTGNQVSIFMSSNEVVVHSDPTRDSGVILDLSRERANWQWMSFFVHRITPGESVELFSTTEEIAIVLLGGKCTADWGRGEQEIGERANVFDGYPYALYLPAGHRATLRGTTAGCEFAECRVPSTAKLEPRLVTPADVRDSLRGGANASRQIVEVMPPDFPADRLIAVEVYTPAGNWSSYPGHKHEVHNPPAEVDLDEIYYYRFEHPNAFALQRLYASDNSWERVVTAHDGDAVLIREGYHPVVAGHGYNAYYLNFLAGSARSLANTTDPAHAWVTSTWKEVSSGLPIVKRSGNR
jgi:5-deoxy-glucuronate isomerase